MKFTIDSLNTSLKKELQSKIDFKTKPLGSLGILEEIALKIGLIQNTLSPKISKPTLIVFAGDHGVVNNHAVSPFPQEVTSQMVFNFLNGGAAINIFCRLNNIQLKIADAGVNYDFEPNSKLIDLKIKKGTKDYTSQSAMTTLECEDALKKGADIVTKVYSEGTNSIGFGEMGIGNTSSASLLMSAFTNLPLEECTGKGTGHSEEGVQSKIEILKTAQNLHQYKTDPLEILANYGGFEITMICGAILQAASLKTTIIIDGFIATSALLVANAMNKNVLEYCLFAHNSDEKGHQKMLAYLNVKPILNLGLRLGEGTGVALAIPTIKASVAFLNEMASFEDAGVTNK